MKRIGIISDTHGSFDEKVRNFLSECDEIWHAGDFGNIATADSIARFRPLHGVYGNIDDCVVRQDYTEFQVFECEQMRVLMTHIGGYPYHYEPRVEQAIRKFRPNIFVSGHSHILKVMPDARYNLLHINPGAAGFNGFHRVRTAVRLTIDAQQISDLEVGEWERGFR